MENQILGMYSSITGGRRSTASGNYSSILGGENNYVIGNYSSILGGTNLSISGNHSTAFNGSSNSVSITASSVAAFLAVSVGVKTTNPTVDLDVNGTFMATTIIGEGSGITGINGGNLGDETITASKIPQGELTGGLLSDQLILQGTLNVNGKNSLSALQVRTNASAQVSLMVSSTGYVTLSTDAASSQLTLKAKSDGLESGFTIVDKDTTNAPVVIYQSSDEGIISLRNSNTENVMLRASGDSFIQGGNLSLGKNTSSALLHLKASADNSSSGLLLEDFDTSSEAARLWQTAGQGQFGLSHSNAVNSILLRANGNSYFENGSLSVNTQTTQSLLTVKSNQDGVQGGLILEDDGTSNITSALYQDSNAGHLQLRSSNTERIRFDANDNSFIDSGANFGIGTNNPTHQLTIYKNEVGNPTDLLITSAQNDSRLVLNADLNSGNSSIVFSRALTNEGSISFDHNASDGLERLSFQVGSGTPLYVHGSDAVSIGTIDTANKLDVEGSIAIGTTYAGAQAAPTNGAIIEGNVGIGTDTPQSSLDVEGSVAIGSTYAGATAAPTDGAIIQGKVGIGEINPNGFTQLAVAGGVAVGTYSPNAWT